MTSTTKISAQPTRLPGVSYMLDAIELEMDDPVVGRVELEFLDFLKCLTDLMKLVQMIKTKHLRSLNPIPPAVLREMVGGDTHGPRYKAWEKTCSGAQPGISTSVENMFRTGQSSVSVQGSYRTKPVYRKEKKRKVGLDADLIEITGKKGKPLWHIVATENTVNDYGPIQTSKGKSNAVEDFSLAGLLDKRSRPIHRSRSEQLLVNIKSLVSSQKLEPSNETFRSQMDMLLAKDAGFSTVAAHKAYLDTQKPHWYKDLLVDAARMGVLYSMEMVYAFEQLGRFYETTSTSIPLAKVKLSYLLMSLPVWDVCQASFQRAFDYFLYTVLNIATNHNIQEEWLKNRKLPYLVHEPKCAELLEFLQDNPDTISSPPVRRESLNL